MNVLQVDEQGIRVRNLGKKLVKQISPSLMDCVAPRMTQKDGTCSSRITEGGNDEQFFSLGDEW